MIGEKKSQEEEKSEKTWSEKGGRAGSRHAKICWLLEGEVIWPTPGLAKTKRRKNKLRKVERLGPGSNL